MPHTGSCLCGQTKVTVTATLKNQILCHCIDCRKASGSAFSTGALIKRGDVTIEGPVKDFTFTVFHRRRRLRGKLSRGHSVRTAERRSALGPEIQGVKTGILDDFVTIPIGAEVFVKDRCTALKALDGVDQFETLPGK